MKNSLKENPLKSLNLFLLMLILTLGPIFAEAVPMDFNGELGFDLIRLTNYRRTDANTSVDRNGSQQVTGEGKNGYVQTYLFKLQPSMIINDHVTVKSEVTTGNGRGGKIGEGGYVGQNSGMGQTHFYHTTANQNEKNNLNVQQLYMELYSETATYKVGRFAKNWGLGAMVNSGEKAWDRFFTYYEGFEAIFSLGKLYIIPSWSNISVNDNLTHDGEIKDVSIGLLYDNPDKDMKMGLYLGKRKTNGSSIYSAKPDDAPNGTPTTIENSDAKLLDLFISRYFGNFFIGLEVPYVTGSLGNVNGSNTDLKESGVVIETSYEFNERWKLGANLGTLSGDKGARDKFTALSLHPNYQIAEIMFRYNLNAITNSNENLFESSMTNTKYLKFNANYKTGLWSWNFAWIYAKANTVASNGSRSFNHERGYHFLGAANQKDDLGHEFDTTFDYQWNPNLTLTGVFAYYMVGDYYAFTNTGNENSTANQFATGLKIDLKF